MFKVLLIEKQRPPRSPPHGPDGTSYAVAWEAAAACWVENPDERPTIAELPAMLLGNVMDVEEHDAASMDVDDLPDEAGAARYVSKLVQAVFQESSNYTVLPMGLQTVGDDWIAFHASPEKDLILRSHLTLLHEW